MIRYPWADIRAWDYAGRCIIAATTGTGDSVRLAYHDTGNLAVLSSVISSARQRPGLQKLSEILND